MLKGDEGMHCSFFELALCLSAWFKISAVFCGKKVILATQEKLSLHGSYAHTPSNIMTKLSLPKKFNFEARKFEKYSCFSKR